MYNYINIITNEYGLQDHINYYRGENWKYSFYQTYYLTFQSDALDTFIGWVIHTSWDTVYLFSPSKVTLSEDNGFLS